MKPHNPSEFDRKFLAYFSVLCVLLIMGYVVAVSFFPVSSTGAKYADMAVPLLLGTGIGAILGFFYGASKQPPKPTDPPHDPTKVFPQAGSVVVNGDIKP